MDDDLVTEARNLRREVATLVEMANRLGADAELGERAAQVQQQVQSLADRLSAEASKADAHEVLNQRTRRFVAGLAFVVVLLAVLTGFVVSNATRISRIQDRTSNGVLCPLYSLLIDSYRPDVVPADQKAQYEHAFVVLRQGYAVLDCAAMATPSPAPGTPPGSPATRPSS